MKIKTENMLKWIVIGLIFLITFPFFQPTYSMGLDPSYVWGLNWLFVNDYQTLTTLTYPYGPLSFLKNPTALGHNLLFYLIFFTILKVGFIYLFFKLSDAFNGSFKSAIPVVLIVCFFVNTDLLIVGICIILNLLFYKQNKTIYLYISALLASIGLFIKISIGIASLSVIFVSLLIDYYHNRNIIRTLKQVGIMGGMGLIIGLLVYQGFVPLFQFLLGVFKVTSGYGDALSIHPYNNWILLSLFLVLIVSFPFWNKEKNVRVAYLLFLLPLFAAWKYGFIRQDISHYSSIIYFLFLFWGIMLFMSKEKIRTFVVACCTILFLYANIRTIPMYEARKMEIVGINNFVDVLHYKKFKQHIFSLSERNIAQNKLSAEQRALIGEHTTDVYPWEFSYIAANNLHWKPRRTVELGTSSSSQWTSLESSKNYQLNDEAPEFILFHYHKDMGSIDGRYILNDEPLVLHNIFNNYMLEEKTDKFLLFRKAAAAHFEKPVLAEPQTIRFNEWIDVPKSEDGIVRLKVSSKNTALGKLKKMFFKDDAYYIDYLLNDGNICTYRYVAGTAVDGLWCSPFVRNPLSDKIDPDAVKIRLRNSSSRFISPNITIQFENIKLKTDYIDATCSPINNLIFKKTKQPSNTVILSYFQDFDNTEKYFVKSNLTSTSTGYSNLVVQDSYSHGFAVDLETIWEQADSDYLTVEANVEFCNYSMNSKLVISLNKSDNDFWEVNYLPQSIRKNIWHYAYLAKKINRMEHGKGTLKVYVSNSKNEKVTYIDDLKVVIRKD